MNRTHLLLAAAACAALGAAGLTVLPGSGPASTSITGTITLSSPEADPGAVTVIAVPLRGFPMVSYQGAQQRLATPKEFGWWKTMTDDEGGFELGLGLDPAEEYALVAAGEGESSPRWWKEPRAAGDDVDLSLVPVHGVHINVKDSEGNAWPDAADQSNDLFSSLIGYETHVVEGPEIAGAPIRRDGHAAPSELELAMLGLPSHIVARSHTAYAQGNEPGTWVFRARVFLREPTLPRPQEESVTLHPTRGGLREVELTLGPGRQRDDAAELVLHFPPELIETVRDGREGTVGIGVLEVHHAGASTPPFAATYTPRFAPGSSTWSTADLPPGDYRLSYYVLANQWLPFESGDAAGPSDRGEGLQPVQTVQADGPTHLHLTGYDVAALRVEDVLANSKAVGPGAAAFQVSWAGRRYHARLDGDQQVLPVPIPVGSSAVTCRVSTWSPDGVRALLGPEGFATIALEPGRTVPLTRGPIIGKIPGWRSDD